MPLCSKIWAKLPWYFIVLPCNIKSGWPSGLRRCVQVAVHFCGRGFESHFWQIFFLDKTDLTIGNDTFFLNQYTDSRVAQWERAGPITQRSVDRNYALLRDFGLFWSENERQQTPKDRWMPSMQTRIFATPLNITVYSSILNELISPLLIGRKKARPLKGFLGCSKQTLTYWDRCWVDYLILWIMSHESFAMTGASVQRVSLSKVRLSACYTFIKPILNLQLSSPLVSSLKLNWFQVKY